MNAELPNRYVFINCPFDGLYSALFRAVCFSIQACGFVPRCALERQDSAEVRLERICQTIEDCALGVHDISRAELDRRTSLPRFNMPFELGLFLGCRRFGGDDQARKAALILDRDPYRFRDMLSDIGGQDIAAHEGDPERATGLIRDWLRTFVHHPLRGGRQLAADLDRFEQTLPFICEQVGVEPASLGFADLCHIAKIWLELNGATSSCPSPCG